MPGVCAAPHCKYNTRKLHVFRFPRDVQRCNQWLINCNRPDLMEKSPRYLNTRCRLCEKHFEDDQFMNPTKSRLTWRAIPTIFDSSDPPESEKRRKLKHSFPSAKRKRMAALGQSCSADHTYFSALDKSALPRRMKTTGPYPETHPDPKTVCDVSGNAVLGLVNPRDNIGDLYECSGVEITAFQAVNGQASNVHTTDMISYCNSSSFGTMLDYRSQTECASITDRYIANVAFQSSDVTCLTDRIVFDSEFNVNTDVISFYNSSIRNEVDQTDGGWTTNVSFEDSAKSTVPVLNFQDKLKDGISTGSMIANLSVDVPHSTRLITLCDSAYGDETLLTKQRMLPEVISSVHHATLGSQKYTSAADRPGAADYATVASTGTVCESSRSVAMSMRKRKRRKVVAASSDIAPGPVDHTYAANTLRKSFQAEDDCACETFSKEQGLMLVQKILSMQKEALVAAKHSKRKSENPTVESVVQGAIQLGMKDSACRFFASQLKNCVRNNKGHRWSALDKTFARDLFVKSREAYKVLEDFFHLPSAATLQRHARDRNTVGS